jgi:hypothetical protein
MTYTWTFPLRLKFETFDVLSIFFIVCVHAFWLPYRGSLVR